MKKLKCCGGQYFCMVLDRLCLELINVTESFVNRLDFTVFFFLFLLPALGLGSWHSEELVFKNYLLYVKAYFFCNGFSKCGSSAGVKLSPLS